MPVIYIDVLIALNLFIDFMLLSACAYIMRLPCRRLRLVLAAVIGGAGCCMVLAPPLPRPVTLIFNVGQAALIVRTAFPWHDIKSYLKQLAVFFIISTLFAGIAFGIWYFLAPSGFTVIRGVVYYDVSPLMLTALTVVSYFAICVYDRLTHKKTARGSDWILTADCGEGEFSLRALYDTGHHVTDVFTGTPVVIVSREALTPHISPGLCAALKCDGTETSYIAVKNRLRMIPCRTVSGSGLLPAFKPEYASVSCAGGKNTDVTGLFLAVAELPDRGGYQAIIGNDITDGYNTKR